MRHALLSVVSLDLSQIGNTVLCFLKCECQYCAFFNLWNAEITGVLPSGSHNFTAVLKSEVRKDIPFLAPTLAVKACLKYAVSLIGQVFVNTNTFFFKLSS